MREIKNGIYTEYSLHLNTQTGEEELQPTVYPYRKNPLTMKEFPILAFIKDRVIGSEMVINASRLQPNKIITLKGDKNEKRLKYISFCAIKVNLLMLLTVHLPLFAILIKTLLSIKNTVKGTSMILTALTLILITMVTSKFAVYYISKYDQDNLRKFLKENRKLKKPSKIVRVYKCSVDTNPMRIIYRNLELDLSKITIKDKYLAKNIKIVLYEYEGKLYDKKSLIDYDPEWKNTLS